MKDEKYVVRQTRTGRSFLNALIQKSKANIHEKAAFWKKSSFFFLCIALSLITKWRECWYRRYNRMLGKQRSRMLILDPLGKGKQASGFASGSLKLSEKVLDESRKRSNSKPGKCFCVKAYPQAMRMDWIDRPNKSIVCLCQINWQQRLFVEIACQNNICLFRWRWIIKRIPVVLVAVKWQTSPGSEATSLEKKTIPIFASLFWAGLLLSIADDGQTSLSLPR